ncbi:MAG TPA: hypothetical protein VGN17_13055 [Bryobacteraceae bacterium]|jgi:hypothetical protein
MLTSLLPFVLLAAGLGGTLALFVGIKRDLHRQSRAHRASIERVLQEIRETERPAPPPAALPPLTLRPGLNVQRRVQALRLLRRGEDISHITAALGVPRREVELLVRVHQLSAKRAAAGT